MTFGSLRLGGAMLFLAAVLHVAALVPAGASPEALCWLPWAGAAALAGLLLTRGWRWLGWLALMATPVAAAALAARLGASTLPDWLIWPIVAVELFAALNLFVALWRRAPRPAV